MARRFAVFLLLAALAIAAVVMWPRPDTSATPSAVARPDATPTAVPDPLSAERASLTPAAIPKARAAASEAPREGARVRTIVWPVKAGTAPIPPDGSDVMLTPWTNSGVSTVPPRGRMEGGRLVVPGWEPGHAAAYAHGQDGGIARLRAEPGSDEGFETAFHVVRTIVVVVTLEDEGPAVGWSVTPYDQGNNPVVPTVATDSTGTARLTDLYGGPMSLVNVRVIAPNVPLSARGGIDAGSVDLAKQDGHLEVTIPREREVVLAVRIDGVPGLPPPPMIIGVHSDYVKEVTRDEAAAELRFRWRPPAGATTASAQLQKAGFATAYAKLEWKPGTAPIRGILELQRAGALLVRVVLPADGRHHVHVQAFNEAFGGWPGVPRPNPTVTMVTVGQPNEADAEGNLRLTALRPGRYRAYDVFSGIVSPEVRVEAGDTPAEVRLDLSTAGWVRGRVQVPPLESFAGVSVVMDDVVQPAITNPWGAAGVANVYEKDGTFSFRVPGDRSIRLRVHHATLRPDPDEGTVEVREPRDGVLLRLIRGPTATVRFDREVVTSLNRGTKRPLAVRLYDGEPIGEPRASLTAVLDADGRSATFGGFDAGTWTLWIDTPPFVPTVLRPVTLTEGTNDLGTATLSEGSRFVIEVKVKEGQSPPRYSVQLMSEEDSTYSRSTDFAGPEGKVTGLARGRYRLWMHAYGGTRTLPQEVIEFDGTSEVRRTLDLR